MIPILMATTILGFPGKTPAEVSGQLAARCVDRHAVVSSASANEVICTSLASMVEKYVIYPTDGGAEVRVTHYLDGEIAPSPREAAVGNRQALDYLATVHFLIFP